MKKIIALFIAVLSVCFLLSVSAGAKPMEFTVSEDFQSLVYNGEIYRQMDTACVVMYGDTVLVDPHLSQRQAELLKGTEFLINEDETIIEARLFFRDGSILSCSYVADSFRHELQTYLENEQLECYIEFYWDDEYPSIAPEKSFKGKPVTLKQSTLQNCDSYWVYLDTKKDSYDIVKGCLLVADGEFYYVDYDEADIFLPFEFYPWDYDSLDCYQITDEALCDRIEDTMGIYYDAAYGTEDLVETLSFIFWVFIFAVIPACILVLSLIFAIRGKGYYRITWGVTAGLSAATLTLFIVLVTMFLLV